MLRRFLERLDLLPHAGRRLSWAEAEAFARQLPPKTNLIVPKAALAEPPPYARSRAGRPRGAVRQFRCSRAMQNLHVKEFQRHWVLHVDLWHPRHHPLLHLRHDHGYRRFLHLEDVFRPAPALAPA